MTYIRSCQSLSLTPFDCFIGVPLSLHSTHELHAPASNIFISSVNSLKFSHSSSTFSSSFFRKRYRFNNNIHVLKSFPVTGVSFSYSVVSMNEKSSFTNRNHDENKNQNQIEYLRSLKDKRESDFDSGNNTDRTESSSSQQQVIQKLYSLMPELRKINLNLAAVSLIKPIESGNLSPKEWVQKYYGWDYQRLEDDQVQDEDQDQDQGYSKGQIKNSPAKRFRKTVSLLSLIKFVFLSLMSFIAVRLCKSYYPFIENYIRSNPSTSILLFINSHIITFLFVPALAIAFSFLPFYARLHTDVVRRHMFQVLAITGAFLPAMVFVSYPISWIMPCIFIVLFMAFFVPLWYWEDINVETRFTRSRVYRTLFALWKFVSSVQSLLAILFYSLLALTHVPQAFIAKSLAFFLSSWSIFLQEVIAKCQALLPDNVILALSASAPGFYSSAAILLVFYVTYAIYYFAIPMDLGTNKFSRKIPSFFVSELASHHLLTDTPHWIRNNRFVPYLTPNNSNTYLSPLAARRRENDMPEVSYFVNTMIDAVPFYQRYLDEEEKLLSEEQRKVTYYRQFHPGLRNFDPIRALKEWARPAPDDDDFSILPGLFQPKDFEELEYVHPDPPSIFAQKDDDAFVYEGSGSDGADAGSAGPADDAQTPSIWKNPQDRIQIQYQEDTSDSGIDAFLQDLRNDPSQASQDFRKYVIGNQDYKEDIENEDEDENRSIPVNEDHDDSPDDDSTRKTKKPTTPNEDIDTTTPDSEINFQYDKQNKDMLSRLSDSDGLNKGSDFVVSSTDLDWNTETSFVLRPEKISDFKISEESSNQDIDFPSEQDRRRGRY